MEQILKAGYGIVNITPDFDVCLGGYGNEDQRHAEGIEERRCRMGQRLPDINHSAPGDHQRRNHHHIARQLHIGNILWRKQHIQRRALSPTFKG